MDSYRTSKPLLKVYHIHATVVENSGLTKSLKRFWELESIGIAETEHTVISREEEVAVADFNRGLKFDGKNYEVRLPWKSDCSNQSPA